MGRPAFEVTQDVIDKAESLAARGLTMEEIASCLGICYDTLNEKSKEYTELSEAIKRGKHKGISIIANALFEGAKSGNVTSQIFYLKARAKWQDRHEEDKSEEATTIMQKIMEKL